MFKFDWVEGLREKAVDTVSHFGCNGIKVARLGKDHYWNFTIEAAYLNGSEEILSTETLDSEIQDDEIRTFVFFQPDERFVARAGQNNLVFLAKNKVK